MVNPRQNNNSNKRDGRGGVHLSPHLRGKCKREDCVPGSPGHKCEILSQK
jgi:hypothetical protein